MAVLSVPRPRLAPPNSSRITQPHRHQVPGSRRPDHEPPSTDKFSAGSRSKKAVQKRSKKASRKGELRQPEGTEGWPEARNRFSSAGGGSIGVPAPQAFAREGSHAFL